MEQFAFRPSLFSKSTIPLLSAARLAALSISRLPQLPFVPTRCQYFKEFQQQGRAIRKINRPPCHLVFLAVFIFFVVHLSEARRATKLSTRQYC